ncbi:MAG: heavy metal-binding domain-containing protein [Nitrososphaerales archaeon]
MICQKCGRTVDDGAAFCPYCGNALKQQMMGASSTPGANQPILLLTSNYAPGYKVDKVLGMTYGITVRSRGLGGNLVAGLRTIAGGEIKEYTELAHQARQEALDRLAQHAKTLGANAVLSVSFDSTEMATNMTEIIAFGTAVVVSPVSGDQQLVKLS